MDVSKHDSIKNAAMQYATFEGPKFTHIIYNAGVIGDRLTFGKVHNFA